eukprot:5401164-Amphidinium_carterae.2
MPRTCGNSDVSTRLVPKGLACTVDVLRQEGWVELSSKKFMPALYALLRHEGVRVVSARSTYEPQAPFSVAWAEPITVASTNMNMDTGRDVGVGVEIPRIP